MSDLKSGAVGDALGGLKRQFRADRGRAVEPLVVLLQQVIGLLTPLITTPLIASRAGIEALGLYAATLASAQYMRNMVEFGFELSVPRELALIDSVAERSSLFWGVMRAKSLVAAVTALLVLVYVLLVVDIDSMRFAVGAILFGLGTALNPIWLLRAVGRIEVASSVLLLTRVAAVAVMFSQLQGQDTAGWSVLSLGLGQLAFLVVALMLCNKHFPWRLRSAAQHRAWPMLRAGRQGLWLKIGQSAFSSQPILLLALGSPTAAAIYSVGERILRAPTTILIQIIQYVYPAAVRHRESDAFQRATSRLVAVGLGVGLVAAVLGVAFSDVTASVLGVGADERFAQGIRLSVLAFTPWLIAQLLGWFRLSAMNRSNEFARSVAAGGAAATATTLLLHWVGGMSPNWAVVVGETVVAISCIFVVRSSNRPPLTRTIQ